MNNKSAALFRAANLRIMDYPFNAAMASALSVCDEAVVVVGQSEDDTMGWVLELADRYPGRIIIEKTRFTFDRGWQERWWNLASSLTDADWLFYHDADECIRDSDAKELRALMVGDVGLIRFEWFHFYATPRFRKVAKAPQYNARLGRRSRGWTMENWCNDEHPDWPACQMVYGAHGMEAHSEYLGFDAVMAPGPLYHYGACRDEEALGISKAKHRAWYADGNGLEDGHVPDVEPADFRVNEWLDEGILEHYHGPHPGFMSDWMARHEQKWREREASIYAVA